MTKRLKILGVHGLGDHRNSTWKTDWTDALRDTFPAQDQIDLEFEFVTYDPIFERVDISAWEAAKAVWKLTSSAAGSVFRRGRGVVGDVSDKIKWTAGYVVAWVEDAEFRRKTRQLLLDAVAEHEPDLILGHSLGSLVTYDAFTHADARRAPVRAALRRARYVTLGSQLANPFVVRNLTPGRITPVDVRHWYHLFNEHDSVFTAEIRLWDAANFAQILTPFDVDGIADHEATEYLKHRSTLENVWRPIAESSLDARAFGSARVARRIGARAPKRERHRALLVGINDYPNEGDRLEGCVNDVFLMSSVLQECGFPAESIRVCLDDRATAKGIQQRLEWLLDDPRTGDERLFYYSGHGATIPDYGEENEPDRLTETLVPHDFDWSPETAITDDQIYSFYSQLPYGLRLAMIFDCCHSGGIHRDGAARARGLDPPDDIRHRAIHWDSDAEMWVPRDFKRLNKKFATEDKAKRQFFGSSGAKTRLGRASLVRGQSKQEYDAMKRKAGGKPFGPYLPLIIEACGEAELSYEYRHGVTSYGAFTWSLAAILRRRQRISFERLVKEVGKQLDDLDYDQRPAILGPRPIVRATVPWRARRRRA